MHSSQLLWGGLVIFRVQPILVYKDVQLHLVDYYYYYYYYYYNFTS